MSSGNSVVQAKAEGFMLVWITEPDGGEVYAGTSTQAEIEGGFTLATEFDGYELFIRFEMQRVSADAQNYKISECRLTGNGIDAQGVGAAEVKDRGYEISAVGYQAELDDVRGQTLKLSGDFYIRMAARHGNEPEDSMSIFITKEGEPTIAKQAEKMSIQGHFTLHSESGGYKFCLQFARRDAGYDMTERDYDVTDCWLEGNGIKARGDSGSTTLDYTGSKAHGVAYQAEFTDAGSRRLRQVGGFSLTL
ncbi:hypothetical protein D3C76_798230 [compost metagenome]